MATRDDPRMAAKNRRPRPVNDPQPSPPDPERLLALLGLAHRAGKLAVGLTAVRRLVRRGERPLVLVASGVGESLRRRVRELSPVRGVWWDCLPRERLAAALGRRELGVVALGDPAFLAGLQGEKGTQ